MCGTAKRTLHTADAETDFTQRCFDKAVVIGMFVQARRVTTGTGKSVERKGINGFIIIILRKGIESTAKNSYHIYG